MRKLEKILEEIDETIERYGKNPYIDGNVTDLCYGLNIAKDIIRKHMSGKDTGVPTNDGWIPVDKQLPEAGEHVLVSFRSAGFLPATAIISENGSWSMLQGAKGFNDVTEDVIAWRPLPEPYRQRAEHERLTEIGEALLEGIGDSKREMEAILNEEN